MKKYIETREYDDGSRGRFEKLNGKHDGLWQIFYPNGKIKWERQMSKGLDHGYSRKFNQDDYLLEERYYFKDVLDGCSKIFDDMGRLKEETFFDMGYALREKVYDAEGNIKHKNSRHVIGKKHSLTMEHNNNNTHHHLELMDSEKFI